MNIPALNTNRVDGYSGSNPNNTPAEGQGSFAGNVWRDHVRPRVGMIVGGLIGGPIGALVGEGAQQLINSCTSREAAARKVGMVPTPPLSQNDITHPLQGNDGRLMDLWLDSQFTPTAQRLINAIDTVLNQNGTINDAVINTANNILKKLATIKAYAQTIRTHGEGSSSATFVQHKADVLTQSVIAIEKSILQHLEKNATQYKTVLETFTASQTATVETLKLAWQGKEVMAAATKYVVKSAPALNNQTDTIITDTNITTNTPATPGNDIVVIKADKKTNWIKTGLGLLTGYLIIKKLVN
ncbi:hypothetical protein [Bizionia myxarmorum]|uniref:Uncharacterized protein n=1 Tax=Bizionia myxarmorum TaxID=291186 RepID=A0A5D0RA19_9FLAO|nr:hypothetical protein [Bizionia myxarmorum]TYB78327.1 hypothetical protein ES674_00675 [Bizionia myxarmorum]